LKKESANGRILIGMVSAEMVKDAPLFGSGISRFKAEYMNRQADYFNAHPNSPYLMNADDVQTPFNEFLKILIEQGVTGLLLFLCLLYCLFEKRDKEFSIIQSIILFILIFGIFSYPFDKLPFVVLFIFSIAILTRKSVIYASADTNYKSNDMYVSKYKNRYHKVHKEFSQRTQRTEYHYLCVLCAFFVNFVLKILFGVDSKLKNTNKC
jgi:hypothetical protein